MASTQCPACACPLFAAHFSPCNTMLSLFALVLSCYQALAYPWIRRMVRRVAKSVHGGQGTVNEVLLSTSPVSHKH
jgi:hypothetical protein